MGRPTVVRHGRQFGSHSDHPAVEIRAAVGVPLVDLIDLTSGNDDNGLQQHVDTSPDPWGSFHQNRMADGVSTAAASTAAATTPTPAAAAHNSHQTPTLPPLIDGR